MELEILNDRKMYWLEKFLEQKNKFYGFTLRRFEKCYNYIWNDKDLWDDILFRHGGIDRNLDEMSAEWADHCIGNLTGMIHSIMIERKIIKP